MSDNNGMAAAFSLVQLVGRGIRGLGRAAANAAPVDDATRHARRRACAACPHARRTAAGATPRLRRLTPASSCARCHCNLLAKTRLSDESCPDDRW